MASQAIAVRGDRAVKQLMARLSSGLRNETAQQMAFGAASQIERKTKEHLSGPYLKVGTQRGGKNSGARLRSSFTTRPVGKRAAILGTPTVYAPTHEFGDRWAYVVPQHFRTSKSGNRYKVRTHTRNANQKERRYLRDAIVKSQSEQIRAIERAYKRLVGR